MRSRPIIRIVKIKKYTFRLEIYPNLEGHREISWEIFPYDYDAALYAFSNKNKLNHLIEKNHIYEPKRNNENTI
jgi:hypothetical protein|tara:strand:- start:1852 stop:2073 length:222 start_codon:yes stop_codon:yes gene_type:complete